MIMKTGIFTLMLSPGALLFGAMTLSGCSSSGQESDGQVIIAAKMHVKEDCIGEFKKIAAPLIEATRQEEGCVRYELYQDASDSTVFFFYEVYADRAAQELHSGSDYLGLFSEQRADMLSQPSNVTIYDVVGTR